jgi:hypothetical protein
MTDVHGSRTYRGSSQTFAVGDPRRLAGLALP